jgi:hypothetical protein
MPARAEGEHGEFGFEGPPPRTDAAGRFELELDAGDYQLLVLGGATPAPGKRFTVVSGQPLDLGDVTP